MGSRTSCTSGAHAHQHTPPIHALFRCVCAGTPDVVTNVKLENKAGSSDTITVSYTPPAVDIAQLMTAGSYRCANALHPVWDLNGVGRCKVHIENTSDF